MHQGKTLVEVQDRLAEATSQASGMDNCDSFHQK